MTSLAQNLATIGWSTEEFARRIGCNERIAELMVTGDADVPPEVADWVQALAIFFVNHPAPRWKGRGHPPAQSVVSAPQRPVH